MQARVKEAIEAKAKQQLETQTALSACVNLGMQCIEAQIPLSFVEGLLDVSTPTVYRWVTGVTVPTNKPLRRRLVRLSCAIDLALEAKALPAPKFDADILVHYWKQSKHVS